MKIGRDVNKMGVREYDYIRGNTALAPERKVKNKIKKEIYKEKRENDKLIKREKIF